MDNNLETKNEYFLKKEEKNQIRQEEKKSQMMSASLKWLGVLVVIGLAGWWVYGYFKTAAVEEQKVAFMAQYYPSQSRDHIAIGEKHPEYNSNPPTGGWHYAVPAQTGIYDKEFPDEQIVHNLEHSHVWIAYRPDLPADQIERLADIAKSYGSKILMTTRAANDSPIALVAWEYLLKMDTVDEAQIRAFIDAYRGLAGPEKLVDSGFKDFRNK